MSVTKNAKTGRYQCRFYDPAGNEKQYTSKKYFPSGITKREAEKIERALVDSIKEVQDRSSEKSIEFCISLYMDEYAKSLEGYKTIESHAKQVTNYLDGELINDVTSLAAEFRGSQLRDGKAASTINKRLSIIRGAATIAHEYGYTEGNFNSTIKNVPVRNSRSRWLTKNQYKELIKHCDNEEARSIIIFRTMTGIRNKEMERLQRSDISKGSLTIDGKNGKFRTFKINKEALEAAMLINFKNKMSYDVLHGHFNNAAKKAKILDINLHDLRHTFASWLAQDGDCTLHQLQQVMGHSTINMTLKYAHLIPSSLDGIASSLSAYIADDDDDKMAKAKDNLQLVE